jgi:hypothetical protein
MQQDNRSVGELFTDALSQMTMLVRKEVQLARAEMSEKVGQATSALPALAAGGAMLLGALLLLLHALALLVAHFFDLADGWGYLIVGAVAGLAGYLMLKGGISRLRLSNLVPNRTAEQLSRDAAVAKEQVR